MNQEKSTISQETDRGAQVALIFALVAERLTVFYEHGQWLTIAQGASLANEWLARSGRKLTLDERKHLSTISDDLARQIAAPLSREAGLYTAHEMMESLDSNYHSELGQALMKECERALDGDFEVWLPVEN
ncbi:MAG: hypothetical protein WCL27_10640 [Betaproteobacteria bacterium]